MATIPTYERQVENEAMPSVRFSANATGQMFGNDIADAAARLAPGIMDAANSIAAQVEKKQRLKDVSVSRDQANAFDSDLRNLEADYYAREGKPALGGRLRCAGGPGGDPAFQRSFWHGKRRGHKG